MNIENIRTQLKERVAKGLNFGIEGVEEVLDPSADTFNDYVLLKSKYNDLMYMSSVNTLPYEQIELALNRLRSSVIELIDRIDQHELKAERLEKELRVNALPTRRENFFRLLDIHFRNLDAICYTEIYSDRGEKHYRAREGVYEFYKAHQRRLKRGDEVEKPEAVRQYFQEYFSHENGAFEVYFNNIKHLLNYAMESEVEQRFFLDTLQSLFSRYELAMVFYYALSGIDPAFSDAVVNSKIMPDDIQKTLMAPGHAQLVLRVNS